jgi:ATP-dependent exoDNAse (exonuclease V) alpha subunit
VEAGGARTIIEKLYKVRAVGQEIHEDMVKYYNVDVGLGRYLKQPLDYTEVTKLLKQFAAKKDWMNYFRLKNEFSDFRFAYASTVHKSQGSTYDTVYIDLEDISVCRDLSQLARMLYVAISRATTRVVFYGTPPKYLR